MFPFPGRCRSRPAIRRLPGAAAPSRLLPLPGSPAATARCGEGRIHEDDDERHGNTDAKPK
jgi:hypothetical protein